MIVAMSLSPLPRHLAVRVALALAACLTAAGVGATASKGLPANAPRLSGLLTPESVDAFIANFDAPGGPPPWIIVDSRGGDVVAALRLAEVMHKAGTSIYVDEICASSCANYLFLAARDKVIAPGALVGWHGSPASERIQGLQSLPAADLLEFEKARLAMVERERRLLQDLGVDPRLLCAGDRTIAAHEALGWTMPIRSMAKFGVKGVVALGTRPFPRRVSGHREPVVVIDPELDCERVYPLLSGTHY
jgi:hypothetical protein